ncbi:ABC1 kinase family protein [Demequina globuliformis]|uniref:ABC1 kinase family protein n=1 Tax=Demequina globuliformis TaxID=676202 RepID=UPI00078080BF|nr:AarF/UbiB family protein [Demequina globuliformis]
MSDTPHGRARYRRIVRFAARHLASIWWFDLVLPRIGLGGIADRTRAERMETFARRFRVLAVELGGLMIKLGQFLSSRLDVLPPQITKELEGLQDEVPPVEFDQMSALALEEFGAPLESVYAHVDPVPVAAASLGQAYRARLKDADVAEMGFADVVIKIQRPNIGEIVDIDLAALRRVGGWLRRFRVVNKRTDMPALIEEFARTSRAEIDYLHEAAASERFAADFADNPRVRVPTVAWERTTRRVLTLEDVSAIKISDVATLRKAGIAPADVANAFASVMYDQFFTHGYFHADPHPGNLFVTPGEGDAGDWTLTFIDFGMMGEVPEHLRGALRALLVASAARDGRGMVSAMQEAGVLLDSADTYELERVMTKVFARFGGMAVTELRDADPQMLQDFALEFADVLVEMPFQLPEDYLLLIRAVSLTSGVCSGLNPAFNVWDSIEPYAAQLLREESSQLVGDIAREAVDLVGIAWRLPRRLDSALERVEEGRIGVVAPKVERAMTRLEWTGRRLISAMVFGALLVSGALVHSSSPALGNLLMIGSLVPLLHVVFGRRNPS